MKTNHRIFPWLALLALAAMDSQLSTVVAQNTLVTYQGRVLDNGTNFNGTGQFEFALVTSTNTSTQATATAVMGGASPYEFVENLNLTYGGSGYVTAPSVTITGGGGSGALARATITGGVVNGLSIISPGSGYTSTPTVTIAAPPPDITYTTHWSSDGTSVNGSQPAAAVSVAVSGGLFTVVLGDTTVANMTNIEASVFAQPNLRLRIWFNDGVNPFAPLDPPQNLTPAPYAVTAQSVAGVLGLSIQANSSGAPNIIAGAPVNFVVGGVVGATISGGGATNAGGISWTNSVTADFGTVAGGAGNAANGYAPTVSGGTQNTASGGNPTVGGGSQNTASTGWATVGGGSSNTASGLYGTVAGGDQNTASGQTATVGGGYDNNAGGEYATVGGGSYNTASNGWATVGGGYYNTAGGGYATVGGGYNNRADGTNATVGGGFYNRADGANATVGGGSNNVATGGYATVPGGTGNVAGGQYSFAAGCSAQAINDGAFVWADGQGTPFGSTTSNQFNVRASGGVRFVTGGAGLSVDGAPVLTTGSGAFGLTIQPNADGEPNVIMGSPMNFVASGVEGATISGGGVENFEGYLYTNSVTASFGTVGGGGGNTASGWYATVGGGSQNTASGTNATVGGGFQNAAGADYATVSGGDGNSILPNAYESFLGGGEGNSIQANAYDSFLGGGGGNSIQTNAYGSFLGGGYGNSIQTNAYDSFLGGGVGNSIQTNANMSFLGGGYGNSIQTNAAYSFLGGGYGNSIHMFAGSSFLGGGDGNCIQSNACNSFLGGGSQNTAGGTNATVGGGYQNTASGLYATVGGGEGNTASGAGAFIGGGGYDGSTIYGNTASGPSSLVAGGTQNIASGSRSTVGGGHNNSATNWYATVPGGAWNTAGGQGSFAAGQAAQAIHDGSFVWNCDTTTTSSTAANQFTARATGGFVFISSGTAGGATLAAGSGSWTSLSDRNAKSDLAPVNARSVLDKVVALPVTTWRYKTQDAAIRHIGPMAQDFKAAFAVGESDTGITTVDAEGVALAAIQGLNQKLEETRAENVELKEQLKQLKALVLQFTANQKGTQP
jgi:hypothetical protein